MRRHSNAFNYADAPIETAIPIVTSNKNFVMGPGKYNPPYKAQIQLTAEILYFTEAAGVYTAATAADILADAINISFPVFFFANGDFASGWAQLQALYPIAAWTYNRPVVYGKDYAADAFAEWDATVTNNLQKGDIVQVFTAVAGGTNYVALIITRCGDVPLASLVNDINSNTFNINMIRYTVADSTAANLAQYRNKIKISNETMFGKLTLDNVNPNSSKNPEQQQTNIIDLDVQVSINKEKGLSTLFNYNAGPWEWNIFIESVLKTM